MAKQFVLENNTSSDLVFGINEHFEEEDVRFVVSGDPQSNIVQKVVRSGYRQVDQLVLEASPPAAISGGGLFSGGKAAAQKKTVTLDEDNYKALAATPAFKSALSAGWLTARAAT